MPDESQRGPVRPRLLIATTHPWTAAIQVGAHAYARQFLARGWDVAMVSMPLTPLHLAKFRGADVRLRWRAWRRPAGSKEVDDFTPLTLLPVIERGLASERIMRAWPQWTVPSLVRQLRRRDWASPDLLLYDTPVFLSLAEALTPGRRIYRVADYLPGFRDVPDGWHELERRAAGQADLVLYTTPRLFTHVQSLAPRRALLIENGVDVAFFSRHRPEPPDIAAVPHPRAIYVGELRGWFDYEAVHHLCARLPNIHVVIVGPTRHAAFRSMPNLHTLGQRNRALVPAYLQASDVGLIPFNVESQRDLISRVNPLKLYEYMAAGLPVVSADWLAVRDLGSPALLYGSRDELTDAVQHALTRHQDLAAAGHEWVKRADWSLRLEALWWQLREWHVPETESARQ